MKAYLCWQNDNTILGVATSEESAKNMCSEEGDSYMVIETDVAERRNIETTELVIYNTRYGFLSYDEITTRGLGTFKKIT